MSIKTATRRLNFALDWYSQIALLASGRWKFDGSTHVNVDGDPTLPIATATLQPGETSVPLETSFLTINQVQIQEGSRFLVLPPTDPRDAKDTVLATEYSVAGRPQKYDYDAHSLFVYPPSDVARIVKVMYGRAVKYFAITDTTVEIGIPSIHAEALVFYAAHKNSFKTNDTNRPAIKTELLEWEAKIRDFYSKRDQDTPRRLKGSIPSVFMSNRNKRR